MPAPGILTSHLLLGIANVVTVWRSVRATGGDLEVASAQSALILDFNVPGSEGFRILSELAVLDSRGADISSIPEPVLRQLEARLPGVPVRIPPQEGS